MGVGGNFWELLKPCARYEDVDWLRGKRVAVDLPFWIVQHDAAIRARLPRARNPHLRTTFFRTIALFSKMGAFPVFVVDGNPSPLKSEARIERFFRSSGLDPSELPKAMVVSEGERETDPNPVKRNPVFARYMQQCTELLELLGIPVLKAESEAESLCAQLNYEGHVDACITADSDAFLFGAKCVIKTFQSNSKEPFECYYLSDIECKLGLKRNHMIAISLLVGNDYALNGVPGFGTEKALRLVRLFNEEEIFDRLREIGEGKFTLIEMEKSNDFADETLKSLKLMHCSNCGHPGSKKSHRNIACEYCLIIDNNNNNNGSEFCIEKQIGFKCICPTCDEERKFKETKRHENWRMKIFEKIAAEKNFPNEDIINLYLKNNNGDDKENWGLKLKWEDPKVEELIDFLKYHQNWIPSYIRQRIFPMLSTIYLRKISLHDVEKPSLIYEQFDFDSVKRVKTRYGHQCYIVKWKRSGSRFIKRSLSEEEIMDRVEVNGPDPDLFNELDPTEMIQNENDGFILTDENMDLVQAAFPIAVQKFLEEQRLKERKGNKSTSNQLSITEFFKSTKARGSTGESSTSGQVQKVKKKRGKEKECVDLDKNLPKSVRRKLLFD